MLRIAVCDDERESLERTAALLSQYAEETGDRRLQILSFLSGEELLSSSMTQGGFDIYILDIVMPKLGGIDLAFRIRENDVEGKIIFLTSTPEYGAASYLAGAFFYLMKPVLAEQLYPVVRRAIDEVRERKDRFYLIKTRDEVHRVSFDDILYVELVRRGLSFVLQDGSVLQSVTLRGSFSEAIRPLLLDRRFFLCGASIAVNLAHVTSVTQDALIFKKTRKVFMPKSACASIRVGWMDFWLERGAKQ